MKTVARTAIVISAQHLDGFDNGFNQEWQEEPASVDLLQFCVCEFLNLGGRRGAVGGGGAWVMGCH
ncbi:MAG: hypothetical protein ACO24U_03195 [Prochlorococcaceae cyanobacterium]|jgi:hypothetical protein